MHYEYGYLNKWFFGDPRDLLYGGRGDGFCGGGGGGVGNTFKFFNCIRPNLLATGCSQASTKYL